MSNLLISADRTTTNYEQGVDYTLNASFNSLTQSPGSQISIVCFMPNSVSYTYHQTPPSPTLALSLLPLVQWLPADLTPCCGRRLETLI